MKLLFKYAIFLLTILFLLAACDLNDDPGDTNPDGPDEGPGSAEVALTGSINASAGDIKVENNMVLVQNNSTGEIFTGITDSEGVFTIDLPQNDEADTYVVTVLGADGQAIGPVTFGEAEQDRSGSSTVTTGIRIPSETDLGSIRIPEETAGKILQPGDDSPLHDDDSLIDIDVYARVNSKGIPVGIESFGKGPDAKISDGQTIVNKADQDADGLIDVLDADDDGDGVVDEFDNEFNSYGIPQDVMIFFFMNLKIQGEKTGAYYSENTNLTEDSLKQDTVITLEVYKKQNASSNRKITSVRALKEPAPAYLTDMMVPGPSGDVPVMWSESQYALTENGDRFDVFLAPHALMNAGDALTLQVKFDDGSTENLTRMINYVFKNIPRLIQYGSDKNDLLPLSPEQAGENAPNNPILFNGTDDLITVYHPPKDELGSWITGMDYSFVIFYYEAVDNEMRQIDGIDWEATMQGQNVDNFENGRYHITTENLPPLTNDTYSITLPKEIFFDTVTTSSGNVGVFQYKIDISALRESNNAAVTLIFQKNEQGSQ